MKVIDILNKIAKGENIPKMIKIKGVMYKDFDLNDELIDKEDDRTLTYKYDDYGQFCEYRDKKGKTIDTIYLLTRILNNDVEIVEDNYFKEWYSKEENREYKLQYEKMKREQRKFEEMRKARGIR